MKRGLMIAIVLALVAGGAGNVVQRVWFGPTDTERARVAAIVQAQRNNDAAAADRLLTAGAVDVGPREMAFTMLPFVAVIGGFAVYMLLRRPRRARWPA